MADARDGRRIVVKRQAELGTHCVGQVKKIDGVTQCIVKD